MVSKASNTASNIKKELTREEKHESMMGAITGHFNDIPLKYIEVREWMIEGKPLKIYYKPITVVEQRHIYKLIKKDDVAFLVETLLVRALDSDGKRLFTLADKDFLLKKASYYVISDIVNQMLEKDELMEDLEGN